MDKTRSKKEDGEANVMEPGAGERRVVGTWDDPADEPMGSVSADDVARPRDREAQEGAEGVVAGFTTTGPSGSQSARSLYGMAPEEETRADDK